MKIFFIAIAAIVVVVGAATFLLPKPSGTVSSNDPNVIARTGLHIHPTLAIYVKGVKQDLPANLGIVGASMAPVHTHDDMPIIHLEFSGLVRKEDITLGKFFEVWGKDMRSFGANVKMTVNGVENTEYEQYIMKDGDKIELRYD